MSIPAPRAQLRKGRDGEWLVQTKCGDLVPFMPGVLVQVRDWSAESVRKSGGGRTWAECQGWIERVRPSRGGFRVDLKMMVVYKTHDERRTFWLDDVTDIQRGDEVRLLIIDHDAVYSPPAIKGPRLRLSLLAERALVGRMRTREPLLSSL